MSREMIFSENEYDRMNYLMTAIMDGTYEKDEELKLEIMNAIAE